MQVVVCNKEGYDLLRSEGEILEYLEKELGSNNFNAIKGQMLLVSSPETSAALDEMCKKCRKLQDSLVAMQYLVNSKLKMQSKCRKELSSTLHDIEEEMDEIIQVLYSLDV